MIPEMIRPFFKLLIVFLHPGLSIPLPPGTTERMTQPMYNMMLPGPQVRQIFPADVTLSNYLNTLSVRPEQGIEGRVDTPRSFVLRYLSTNGGSSRQM